MTRLAPLLMVLTLITAGCSSTGDAADLKVKEFKSYQHGEQQLTSYALGLLAAMTQGVITEMEAFHAEHVGQLVSEGKAAEAVTAEKQYQAQLLQIEMDLLAEYEKIARMGLDFRNAARFHDVIQKSIENAGTVDINEVIGLAADVATATGLDLGPVNTVLQNLKKARGLPAAAPMPLVTPVQ